MTDHEASRWLKANQIAECASVSLQDYNGKLIFFPLTFCKIN